MSWFLQSFGSPYLTLCKPTPEVGLAYLFVGLKKRGSGNREGLNALELLTVGVKHQRCSGV